MVKENIIMEFWIGIILLAIVFGIPAWQNEQRIQHKNPLDVDNSKMTRDICNGVSQSEIRRRYGNGYYDKTK